MGKKLIIAPSACRDLHDIAQEIARDAPERAVKFGDALLDRAQQAADFPNSGRMVPEFGRPDLRELIHAPIRIIYRVRPDDVVEVVRFWHAARGTPET
jgi:plasmid stabilization system protein ParE